MKTLLVIAVLSLVGCAAQPETKIVSTKYGDYVYTGTSNSFTMTLIGDAQDVQ